ncbi:MAG: DUF2961 domain-containing protein, partial [Bacteroidales bacterium]|nr:DUF2961 domain-containing protein [Bacteroidales bacterium]
KQGSRFTTNLMDIRFDGAPSGQVQTPVGDFFGAAPGINPYESLPFSVFRDGRMLCRYVMPFRDTAEILFRNLGDQEVTVSLKVIDEPYHWVDGSSMYFRARWRVNHEMPADPARVQDIPFLLIRGKGRMVGTAVYIMNPTSVPSSAGNWWGEGDEKIFIDDHLKASFIGTGSEDYFNYAWSSSALFAHAYCGQPRNDGPANRGFVSNYRWHILDNIPFEQSFDFYMELYSHRPVPHFSYGRMIYLYAFPECHDDHMTITGDDVRTLEMPVNWSPRADGWASNSIFYQVEDLLSGHADYTLHESYLWSDGEMMKWLPEHTGDRLNLRIPVSASGNYQIILTAAEMPGSGSIRMLLDGKLLKMNGKEVSQLSSIYQPVSRNFKSGNMALQEGMHVLTIESSDSASGPVGLDFIWIKKK